MGKVPAQEWLQALQQQEEQALAGLVETVGFADVRKSVTNLLLLQKALDGPQLLPDIAETALATADPDLSLNNLERLTDTVPVKELNSVLGQPTFRRCLLTVLGSSPFLTGILCRTTHYFTELFSHGELQKTKQEADMLAELRSSIPTEASFAELQKGLRLYKAREILRIGSRDLCGLASLEEVTGELTHLAAASLQSAYETCSQRLHDEYGSPALDDDEQNQKQKPEFTILGMGKFGGRELNFSSDIDLIYFYTSDRGQTTGIKDAAGILRKQIPLHKYYVRLSEMITKAIGQVTEDGFVFRVDLRLRPEGNSGEMANSLLAAEIYYESWGQSWERSAMLKARPVAGSITLGEHLLNRLEPFIYRRHLDYAMIEDIKTMKQKIDCSLSRAQEDKLNLKLGCGGIREIEFFIQALQLIYAGKTPSLRERNSLKALALLEREGLVKHDEATQLSEAYRFLRTVEHRIQIYMEQQTHNVPVRTGELRALARRSGFPDETTFNAALQKHRDTVSNVFRDLFYTSEEALPARVNPRVAFLFSQDADPDQCKDILEAKGFTDPEIAYESLTLMREGGHGRLTERARRELNRIAPLLFQEVLDSPDPPLALRQLEQFLISCRRARGTYYALLAENPSIIRTLVSLFATSHFLSHIFIKHPEILDSLVSSSHAVIEKGASALATSLNEYLATAEIYEDKLDALRRFRNEEILRIALNDLQGELLQGQITSQLSLVADVCLQAALNIAQQELVPRYGLPFCCEGDACEHQASFAIIGLGKLGGMELNYHSDLDIIFIYEGEGHTLPVEGTDPDRYKLQTNQQYFARLAQRIISVLTLMTREGSLYEIDTRLRPSGNQGPLVISLPAFETYHERSAAPWERQALLKARVIAGDETLAAAMQKLTAEIVYERPLPDNLAAEISRLRQRMERELGKEDTFHKNIKTGHGGMVDVEFVVQFLQLQHGRQHAEIRTGSTLDALQALQDADLIAAADAESLANGYKFLRRLENKLRLVHNQSINQLSGDPAYLQKLARHLGYTSTPEQTPEQMLAADYARTTEHIRRVFEQILGRDLHEQHTGTETTDPTG